MRKVT